MKKRKRLKQQLMSPISHLSSVAQRLLKSRVDAGFTSQARFAKALGVSRGLIGQWESGSKVPGRQTLARAAKLCGVSMEYLCGESDNHALSTSAMNANEVRLLLAYRQLTMLEQERLLEFFTTGLKARRMAQKEKTPT